MAARRCGAKDGNDNTTIGEVDAVAAAAIEMSRGGLRASKKKGRDYIARKGPR